MNLIKKDFIFQDIKKLKGVGTQLSKYLRQKKVEKIKDIIFDLPYSETFSYTHLTLPTNREV